MTAAFMVFGTPLFVPSVLNGLATDFVVGFIASLLGGPPKLMVRA